MEVHIKLNEETGQIAWSVQPGNAPVMQLLGLVETFKMLLSQQALQQKIQRPQASDLALLQRR